MTGCTFGKGNLIHLDYGKNAFTFIRRSDSKAIRVAVRPDAWGEQSAEQLELLARVRRGETTGEERDRFEEMHVARAHRILERPLDELFDVQPVAPTVPARARLHRSVTCAGCNEPVMETRSRLFRGQPYCAPCFEARDRRY